MNSSIKYKNPQFDFCPHRMARKVVWTHFFYGKHAKKTKIRKNEMWKNSENPRNHEKQLKKGRLLRQTDIVISDNDRKAFYGCFLGNTAGTPFFEKRTTPESLILCENPKISLVFYENPPKHTTMPKLRASPS